MALFCIQFTIVRGWWSPPCLPSTRWLRWRKFMQAGVVASSGNKLAAMGNLVHFVYYHVKVSSQAGLAKS